MAKKIFVNKQAISKWESGKGYPDAAILPSIAEALDISIDQLMGTKEFNKTKNKIRLIRIGFASGLLLILISLALIPILNRYNNAQSIQEIENMIIFDIEIWRYNF